MSDISPDKGIACDTIPPKTLLLENGNNSKPVTFSTEAAEFPLPKQSEKPTKVLECDEKTPDAHVPRDSRLIRLTGIHPFNCEPPLSILYDNGFLTPQELWFVRNHGPVPKVLDSEIPGWEFTIEGLVEKPMTLTLNELLKFPQVTLPMTMVCAGNRRKEQNVIRKGLGFNWGSAGVSTALYTGVLVNEVLKLANPKKEARYMCMEGIDKLPNGNYGTSIRLSTAMDPAMGVMLAHKMNGEPLTPDHGRPLRVVIPGQIGGRSVKWLKRLMISDKPSTNWYHIYDNRVLPTMATPEIIAEDKSWYNDERYALYNLNVQSVICYPAQGEILKVEQDKTYTLRGYAYNGGGVRVGRVEISLNQGRTWKLTKICYPEDCYREAKDYPLLFDGKLDMADRVHSFCWCFWHIEIGIIELSQANDIVVRAMDESMNIQPRDMYWNILSMLNNCWHRVAITHEEDKEVLVFDHPTIPALTNGGWMEKVKAAGGEPTDGFWGSGRVNKDPSSDKPLPPIKMIDDSVTRIITEEELLKHNKDGDTWFAVKGHVYDVSEYLAEHPGGVDSIVLASGADATDDFMGIHSETSKAMLAKYHIGILKTNSTQKNVMINGSTTHVQRSVFLQQKQWTPATLKTKKIINHDSVLLTFTLEHPNQKFGVPTGKHFYMRCMSSTGEKVIRSYTPVSDANQSGEFNLIVKLYRNDGNRSTGKMSACISSLKEGDTVDCKGPFGDFEYQGDRTISNKGVNRKIDKLTIIAGGSGITGIYQILECANKDGVECHLIDCNKTEEDILLCEELKKFKRVHHCLSRLTNGRTSDRGYISTSLVGPPHNDLLLCCGPPAMMDSVHEIAKACGWNVDEQFVRF